MLPVICGAGFLVCVSAVALLIFAYVRNRSFLLPLLLFALGLFAAVGSLSAEAGGWPEGGSQEPAAGQLALPDGVTAGPADAVSLEALSAVFEMVLSGAYSGCSVTQEDGGLKADVWLDGLEADGGESWMAAREGASAAADSLRETMDSVGYAETPVTLRLLSGQDWEKLLLSIVDGEITYDILEEATQAAKNYFEFPRAFFPKMMYDKQ